MELSLVEGMAHFGVITITNLVTPLGVDQDYVTFHTLETPRGSIVIEETMVPNNQPDPRDIFQVMELPKDVIAIPDYVLVDERHSTEIKLFVFEGV